MSSAISNRLADFLFEFPPFTNLEYQDILGLCDAIKVINLEKKQILFKANEALHEYFYVVYSGTIHLNVISDGEEILLNKCYQGDLLGLRPFFAKNNYKMNAIAWDESVILAIPVDLFKPFVTQNIEVSSFVLESFAYNIKGNGLDADTSSFQNINSDLATDVVYFQSLSFNRNPVTISPESLVTDAAIKMTENLLDNALVLQNNFPVGMVTDSDLRSKIVTGKLPLNSVVSKIMASPVVTVTENISVAEAQLVMLKYNVSHLCVTNDGSNLSEVLGVISEHDLVVAQSNNPGILVKEIKKSQNAKELKLVRDKLANIVQSSIYKNIPLFHINSIAGEITLVIVKRAVEIGILELGSPPAKFAWLSIGSQGRKEQLLYTDQDSILIFEDVAEDKYRDTKDYFLKLAKKVIGILEKVGYPLCAHDHMASTMSWCKSVTDWVKQYESWMQTPGEVSNKISSVFFDYEMTYGEQNIENIITETIFKTIKKNVLFFDYLGNDALKKPAPLNFFKKFNLEEDVFNKGKFDIKTRALQPLIDGARLFVLNYEIKGINNTYLRYKQLAITDSVNSEIYLNCAEAFVTLSKFRTLEALKNDSDGQFIALDELSKLDKEKLKNVLQPMKELEELIKDRFQLTQFS
jgi:CBS domain-containing protein